MHKTPQFQLISISVAFLIRNSFSENYGTINVTTAKVIKNPHQRRSEIHQTPK